MKTLADFPITARWLARRAVQRGLVIASRP